MSARVLEAETDGGGPTALRLALSPVSVGVECCDDCPTGDRHPMASGGLPAGAGGRARGRRPKVPLEIRRLIREMSLANRLWGAPGGTTRGAQAGWTALRSAVAPLISVALEQETVSLDSAKLNRRSPL